MKRFFESRTSITCAILIMSLHLVAGSTWETIDNGFQKVKTTLKPLEQPARRALSHEQDFWWNREINEYLLRDMHHAVNGTTPGESSSWWKVAKGTVDFENASKAIKRNQHLVWGTVGGAAVSTLVDRLLKDILEDGSSEQHWIRQGIKHSWLAGYGSLLFNRPSDFSTNRLCKTVGTIVALDTIKSLLFTNKRRIMDEADNERERARIHKIDYLRLRRATRDAVVTLISLLAGGTIAHLTKLEATS